MGLEPEDRPMAEMAWLSAMRQAMVWLSATWSVATMQPMATVRPVATVQPVAERYATAIWPSVTW